MLSLKLVDLSGLDNMRKTTLETQLQVVGVSSEGGGGFMSREVVDAEAEKRRARESRALAKAIAIEKDRQVRVNSVARDLELGLPTSIQQPDGEEYPRTCSMQLRSYDQRTEIVKGFIQGPPNRTISNSSDWGDGFGSGLEVKGRQTSKSNSCSCLLPGQQPPTHLKPSSSTSVTSVGACGTKGSSPLQARSPKCHVHSRPSSSSSSSSKTSSSCSSSSKQKGSPSVSTHSSLISLPTSSAAQPPPHKPTFTEKLQNMFSDKSTSSSSPNNNSTSAVGFAARLLSDETKCKISSKSSSKVKGQSTTFGRLKGDFKKISNLPPTETQVYHATVLATTTRKCGTGAAQTLIGESDAGKNGAGRDHRLSSPLTFVPSFQADRHCAIGFASDRIGASELDQLGSFRSDQKDLHMRSEDSNGNERERAYSDSSTLRKERVSMLPNSSDLSQSRMSLCYEGEDSAHAQVDDDTHARTQEWNEGDLTTEPQGFLSSIYSSSQKELKKSEQDPSSFLYQHIHHPDPSSMNVSQTPPPPPDP